jgi:hypothetical protein
MKRYTKEEMDKLRETYFIINSNYEILKYKRDKYIKAKKLIERKIKEIYLDIGRASSILAESRDYINNYGELYDTTEGDMGIGDQADAI